jgi:hypothetical protein
MCVCMCVWGGGVWGVVGGGYGGVVGGCGGLWGLWGVVGGYMEVSVAGDGWHGRVLYGRVWVGYGYGMGMGRLP